MEIMLGLCALFHTAPLQDKDPATTMEAMQRVQNVLIGKFRCTGSHEDRKKKPWQEKVGWNFKIKAGQYSLEMTSKDGQFFRKGLLEYDVKKKRYRFRGSPVKGAERVYEGKLVKKKLTLEETTSVGKKQQRLVFILLRFNRYLLRIEEREGNSKYWSVISVIGCTKEGVPFVRGGSGPKCIVTGGYGTIRIEHRGKQYYVC